MTLHNTSDFPHLGYTYNDPRLSLVIKGNTALQPFLTVARIIQQARINNRAAGLDPSLEACATALADYTCHRLKNDPRWCTQPADAVARTLAANVAAGAVGGCGGCGTRRARKRA